MLYANRFKIHQRRFSCDFPRFTSLISRLAKAAPCQGIATVDVLRSYLGLLCQGKNDFEAIRPFHEDDKFFAAALGVQKVPSPETLRQRMDKIAEASRWIVNFCTIEFIKKVKAKLSPLPSGHMPLDMDVFFRKGGLQFPLVGTTSGGQLAESWTDMMLNRTAHGVRNANYVLSNFSS